jgi:predicted nucleic acid-binding Zn ribbon protein
VRRLAPRPLASSLERATALLAPATTLARVQARWRAAVGSTVAEEATPVSERDGTVTVACRSAVWAQELDLLSTDLLEGLHAALDEPSSEPTVRGLRFVATDGRRRRGR